MGTNKEYNVSFIPKTNQMNHTTQQTPIEIALKIDENGMTTASSMHAFLELHPSNFPKWCKRNIEKNSFVTENIDYFKFVVQYESVNNIKPKIRTDYKITLDFAKKLSMIGNSEKHKQARQYFIACEQGLKVSTQKPQEQGYELINKIATVIENMNITLSSINEWLTKLEEQTSKNKTLEKRYSCWKNITFSKLNTLLSFVNTYSTEKLQLSEIIHLVIDETENTYNIEINDYVDAYKSEFDLDTNPCVIDVINHYKDVKDMFTLKLDLIIERFNIADNTDEHARNIFDEIADAIN